MQGWDDDVGWNLNLEKGWATRWKGMGSGGHASRVDFLEEMTAEVDNEDNIKRRIYTTVFSFPLLHPTPNPNGMKTTALYLMWWTQQRKGKNRNKKQWSGWTHEATRAEQGHDRYPAALV